MRTATTLVGLTLFALAGTARAQEAAPAAATTTPPAGDAAAAAPLEPPAAPAPALVAAPATAPPAAVAAASPAPVASESGQRKLQLGVSFLSMALGKYTYVKTTEPESEEAYFAYGLGLAGVYEVLPGLLVGLAPQLTLNVRPKSAADAAKELDVMARVAYAYRLPDGISVYAEVLPGYSMILLKRGASPKGLVLAFGAGCAMDLTNRIFASIGAGYQIGFHNQSLGEVTVENRTRYLRVALGGGVRF
jgi:hypothetical protein